MSKLVKPAASPGSGTNRPAEVDGILEGLIDALDRMLNVIAPGGMSDGIGELALLGDRHFHILMLAALQIPSINPKCRPLYRTPRTFFRIPCRNCSLPIEVR